MHDLPVNGSSQRGGRRAEQPYLDWAIATRFTYLRPGHWLPLLVRFDATALPRIAGKTALEVFASRVWLSEEPRRLDGVLEVPELFVYPPTLLKRVADFCHCIVLLRRDPGFVRSLVNSDQWHKHVISAQPGPPFDLAPPSFSPAVNVNSTTPTAASGSTISRVAIGVIDQGVAFANSRFSRSGAGQIAFIWQQDFLASGMPTAGTTMSATPGIELSAADIAQAKATTRSQGGSDDAVYRLVGGLDYSTSGFKPLARRRSHGTHVASLAAAVKAPSQHPLLVVDMPEQAVGDPAGSTLSVHAAWGLIYLIDRVEKLRQAGETLPLVVNLSYGPHEGPHDGSADLERFMDAITTAAAGTSTPLRIVLAAGNFRQARVHATFSRKAGKRQLLRWRLQPTSLMGSLMEIWLPPGHLGNAFVELKPPTPSLPALRVSALKPSDQMPSPTGELLYHATYTPADPAIGRSRACVVLGVARTGPDPASNWHAAVAPSGVWRVIIGSDAALLQVHAWIKRADTQAGRRSKGRQSYFDDPRYARFHAAGRPLEFDPASPLSYVVRTGTLSGIATGRTTRVIGGRWKSSNRPVPYSSIGPDLNGKRAQPDGLAPAERSTVLRGVLAAGNASGSIVAMNGTSVAAPQAAAAMAEQWLATGIAP
jgi:hypothetical protein